MNPFFVNSCDSDFFNEDIQNSNLYLSFKDVLKIKIDKIE